MLHQTIKEQIKDALRQKDTVKLETLRSLNALFLNEMIASNIPGDYLPDEKAMPLVKRSVKQRRDSIEQFTKGGRQDLVEKEKAELAILESYLPQLMSRQEIHIVARNWIEKMKSAGSLDLKAAGKIMGMIMKELAGKADGQDVKAVVDDILKEQSKADAS